MKHLFLAVIAAGLVTITVLSMSCSSKTQPYCLTGAFLADSPTISDIDGFKKSYGKKPYMVMVFAGWGGLVDEKVIKDVYSEGCVLFVTWEPWDPATKEGIDFDKVLSGGYDGYIGSFGERLKSSGGIVFIRFAHEMNGDWYPWSGLKIGREKYIAVHRYLKTKFDKMGLADVKWVFSVNWEDVPKENNHFMLYYPGDGFVDYIGIDGYNWGDTKPWSSWMSFKEIFAHRYEEIMSLVKKPVLISEFSSTGSGGDKAAWIKDAIVDMKQMRGVAGFVLFNVDKETDWSFPADALPGKALKRSLEDGWLHDSEAFRGE
ncbi:MAG: glycosyl hydrolase [Candidatus Omnitrophota bacterium]